MKIEIRQRRNKGDNEGYECGSKHQLMFNIWKVEKDWRSLTRREVQINPTTDDTHNKPAPKEHFDELDRVTNERLEAIYAMKLERVTNEGADPCRDRKETNDTYEESVKKISGASQAATLMDEQKEEQRPWEETPDTPVSVGATAGLSNTPSREAVGGETQGKEEAAQTGEFEQTVGAEE